MGKGVRTPHVKSHVALGFLRNTGTDHAREGAQLLLEGGQFGPLGNTLRQKTLSLPSHPTNKFSGSTRVM